MQLNNHALIMVYIREDVMTDWEAQGGQRVHALGLGHFMERMAGLHTKEELTFLCIGTDRSTGDSLGPWVGTLLLEQGFTRVIGTLEFPCDADNLPKLVPKLAEMGTIVAIDACLGRPENVGSYLVKKGPLIPAQSVGKGFAEMGTYSIAGIVNAVSPKPYWTLQSTSLYRVMGMAKEIAESISNQWRL
jgi:putative sporulation protein YyaC